MPVGRICTIASIGVLCCSPLRAEKLTLAHCMLFAEHVQKTASTIDGYEYDARRNNMVVDLAGAAEGETKVAATEAAIAYNRFLQAAKDYHASLSKLEHVLEACPQ